VADDDIERLLREVNAMNAPAGQQPARKADNVPATRGSESSGGAGGRLAFAVGSGVVIGWFAGLLMPFVGSFSAGVGAAFGAFAASLIAGPPRWFSS
jgi:hypothetical protein